MGKWLDLARDIDAAVAVSAVSAERGLTAQTALTATGASPALREIGAGVERLRLMPAPRKIPRAAWAAFVDDAQALVFHGIAGEALAKGWAAIDLFGVSADESWQCLAGWIGGRRDDHGRACYLLTEIRGERTLPYAVQAAGTSRRWHYPEPAPSDAVLPWSM